jgi:hypothetical protein
MATVGPSTQSGATPTNPETHSILNGLIESVEVDDPGMHTSATRLCHSVTPSMTLSVGISWPATNSF